jgi:hypothetical protein
MSILLSFSLPSTKINHYFRPKKGYVNKYFSRFESRIVLPQIELQMIQIRPFKEKEKERGEGRS